MNFLLRHSFSSSDLPLVGDLDMEGRASSEAGGTFHSPFYAPLSGDSTGEDVRAAPGVGGGDVWRSRNRMVIEDHYDVLDDDGGILIPRRELPGNWRSSGNVASLVSLDRGFVFPGEQLCIVVYFCSRSSSVPEIITPFRVAAMMSSGAMQQQLSNVESDSSNGCSIKNDQLPDRSEVLEDATMEETRSLCSGKNGLPVSESLLKMESQKKKSAVVLESFQNSHFFTRIAGADEPLWQKRSTLDHSSEHFDSSKITVDQSEYRSVQSIGVVPLMLENGSFDPKTAGGVARNAVACDSFANGDIAVLLQVTVATDLTGDAVLEVLQFEQPQNGGSGSLGVTDTSFENCYNCSYNPSQHLLHWLLPLDRPSSPPPFTSVPSSSGSIISNSPQRLPFSGSASSTLFSFGHSRSSSLGSFSQNNQSWFSAVPSHSTPNYGSEEWDRLATQKVYKGQDVGSEGLLSFRGAQLEPQRFSVHCGLEGLYVPGKRWRRKVEIVQPLAVESYFADCNTKDLICVLIENTIPSHIPDAVIIVDSISIVCQSASPNSFPLSLSLPIACVEVGESHKLPGLLLRAGEQHSFILKPASRAWRPSVIERDKLGASNYISGQEVQVPYSTPMKSSSVFGGDKDIVDGMLNSDQDLRSYVLIISCRCNQTESKLHFKHHMQWQPRATRDLLLSVSVEPCTAPVMPNGTLPQLLSQVLTVQATNLTSEDLKLTLLAPSSKSSTSAVPLLALNQVAPRMSSFMSFHERNGRKAGKDVKNSNGKDKSRTKSPGLLQRSMSLPPARPIESIMGMSPIVVKERTISAADIAAEQNSSQTHLWLQSTVPLGCVPARSTTAVRCELLPLIDGIITLDTLHISKKEEDFIYIPEQPLQIYSTSGIASRLS